MKYVTLLFVVCAFLFGCNSKTSPKEGENTNIQNMDNPDSAKDRNDISATKNLVYQWNIANNRWDTAALRPLYAKQVKMYGKDLSNAQACNFLMQRFKQYSHYSQRVARNLSIIPDQEGKFNVSFIRIIDWGETKTELSTNLVLEKEEGKWVITAENEQGGKPIAPQNTPNKMNEHFESCESLCISVIMSSSLYKSFKKNYPTAELMENTKETTLIHPEKKEGEREFILKIGKNRFEGSVFFIVYPKKEKLTAYNVEDNTEQTITYAQWLAPYFRQTCK